MLVQVPVYLRRILIRLRLGLCINIHSRLGLYYAASANTIVGVMESRRGDAQGDTDKCPYSLTIGEIQVCVNASQKQIHVCLHNRWGPS